MNAPYEAATARLGASGTRVMAATPRGWAATPTAVEQGLECIRVVHSPLLRSEGGA